MEILSAAREKSTLVIAGLAVLLFGLGLAASAWHNLDRQRQALDQHLYLAAESVHQTIRATLWRNLGMRAMSGPDALAPAAEELFEAIQSGGDVLFVAAMGPDGSRLILSDKGRWTGVRPVLGEAVLEQLRREGRWHGVIRLDSGNAFVMARKIRRPDVGMHGGRGPGMGMGMRLLPGAGNEYPEYLVVGLDMEKHLELYNSLKRSILFTVGYVLVAGVLVMGLALAVIRRQGAARKAESLERLQAKLLDAMPEGLLLVDRGGWIKAANPAAHAILGIPGGALVGRKADSLPLPLAGITLPMEQWISHELGERRLELLILDLPKGAMPE